LQRGQGTNSPGNASGIAGTSCSSAADASVLTTPGFAALEPSNCPSAPVAATSCTVAAVAELPVAPNSPKQETTPSLLSSTLVFSFHFLGMRRRVLGGSSQLVSG